MSTVKRGTEALSYLRVSGKSQIEGDGFPRQRIAVNRFARAAGYSLIDEYRDEGVSGELEERDGLAALYARIRANGVRTVLVERADRLARDLMVSELILAEFRKLGAQVIDSSGNELTVADADPTRVLIRQVLAAVAQFEKSVIVSKLRAARVRMRRAVGRCEGRKPFGRRPGEADTLQRMRQLARKPRGGTRMQFVDIAATLNTEGRATRTGAPWSATMVRRLLGRPGLAEVV